MDHHGLFKATPDEIDFTECIRRATLHKSPGTFSRDVTIRIFKESGLSFKQIRELWTIADRDGDGKLSTKEMCVAVRLAGWVQQRGETVSESLLSAAGPLPVLKGVIYTPRRTEDRYRASKRDPRHSDGPYNVAPRMKSQGRTTPSRGYSEPDHIALDEYPPITIELQRTCRHLFETAEPIHSLMDRETAQEILMQQLGAPFFVLESILNLVRTSYRLSLNIREFTLASYFVNGLLSGAIRVLPSKVPQSLYDQLWTPILLSCTPNSLLSDAVECRTESRTSTASSDDDPHLTAPFHLSPVRKVAQRVSFEQCPSVSSVETREITTLWKRVAKHCKIEKVLKMSSTRKSQRASVGVSDVSVNGTVETESSGSSFEALERDSFLYPTRGESVSIDMACLPLIYPSKAGYYAALDPEPVEVRQSFIEGSKAMQNNIVGHFSGDSDESMNDDWPEVDSASLLESFPFEPLSSIVDKEPANESEGDGTSIISAFALEQPVGDEAGVENMEVDAKVEATSEVLAMFTNIKDECTLLRLQMQIMHKAIRNLEVNSGPVTRSDRSEGGVEADLRDPVRDSVQSASGTSIRAQSLKLATKLAGPRDVRSIRSVPSVLPSQTRSHAHRFDHRSHRQEEGSEAVQGSKPEDMRSIASSRNSISSRASQPKDSRANDIDRVSARKIKTINQDVQPRTPQSLETPAITTKYHEYEQVARIPATADKQLQAGNEGYISDDKILVHRKTCSTTRERTCMLPRPRRSLPTPKTLSPEKVRGWEVPPLPVAPSPKFSDTLVDIQVDTSSCGLVRKTTFTDDNISSGLSGVSRTTSSRRRISEIYADVLRGFLSTDFETPPDSTRASKNTVPVDVDKETADSLYSPSEHSHFSVLSSPGSTRSTFLTDSVYDGTVDHREAGPELVAQVEKSLGGKLHATKSGRSAKNVYHGGMEALQQYVQVMMDWVEAPLQVGDKVGLEDNHKEFLRQQARELTMLERENESLRWLIADQEKQIYYLGGTTAAPAQHAVEPPKYTSGW